MKTNLPLFPLMLFLLLADFFPAMGQEVSFTRVTPPEVNPWIIVTSVTQDPQGYMWFGGNGLYRYDGLLVTTYRNDPLNPNSLVDNSVECVFADANGIIWIGTLGAGLDRFDPVKNSFTHYRHQPNNMASLGNDTVTVITKDHEGNIWIGTHGGLERLDTKTGQFIHYRHNANDSTSLSNNHVRIVYVDRQGIVWAGTGSPFFNDAGVTKGEGGLNRLNRKAGKFTRYTYDPTNPNSLIDNRVRAIYEDSRGTFWVGTAGDGLHSLDRATGKFKRYPYDPAYSEKISRPPLKKTLPYVDDHITFIKEDATGALWIGTMMGGITHYNSKTEKITRYGIGTDSTGGFRDNSGWAAYSSRDGTLWISTWEANLFRIDPFRKSFPYNNIGEHVHGVYKEAGGVVWICTHNGLILTDADKKIQKKFPTHLLHRANIESINMFTETEVTNISASDANIESINMFFRDRAGKFWIATDYGLTCFDPQTEKYTNYTNNTKDKKSLNSNHVISICEDRELNFWVGTFGGLDKMDRKTGEFFHYRNDPKNVNTFTRNIVSNLLEDRKNQLWVGTASGINKLDPQTGKFKNYLKGIFIQSIFEDAEGVLWVGVSDGLFRFNPTTDSFTSFVNPSSGIRFKNVSGINEDDQKKLWLYTPSGIFRLNQQRDSTNAFGKDFGLKNIISDGRILNSLKGEFFLGDQSGYYNILPDQVSGNFIPPQVAFTDFRLGEQSVMPGSNSPLRDAISRVKEIRLNYQQNVFSFDFDVLHFSNPENNQHLYKLENYDGTWRQSGAERRASYYNVPPGRYVFRVKAANSNGTWTEKDIAVIISPPWWRTWWAYTIFALLLVVSIWGFIYYRSRKLRRENRILEEKVTDRTAQLQQSLEDLKSTQAQLVQREKMASLGELTAGIAHEIQNPLNFVNNFSEVNGELINEMKQALNSGNTTEAITVAEDIEQNLEKINHHGKRADAIVKGMLQHSRGSTGKKEPTDINALVDEYLRLCYHGLRAKDKSFNATIQTNFDKSIEKLNIVPQDIGRVLLNIFNNAFYSVMQKKKQLSEGYEPTVSVSTKKITGKIEIRVRDNGIGIPQNIVEKIFQPFFTTKPTGQGTGLGLSLSYDIIKSHGGELKVQTKEGEFAEFIVHLPSRDD